MHFAAEELSRYLQKMTGQPYTVTTEAAPSATARVVLKVDSRLHHDGYQINARSDGISIAGGSPRLVRPPIDKQRLQIFMPCGNTLTLAGVY